MALLGHLANKKKQKVKFDCKRFIYIFIWMYVTRSLMQCRATFDTVQLTPIPVLLNKSNCLV